MKIGFIGLGNMGAAMAANLVKAGHELAVWNRSKRKADPLVAAGAVLAPTPAAAAAAAEVVVTMLSDDAALDAAVFGGDGLLTGMKPNALHVSMSTIAVATAERIGDAHRSHGQRFVCAPVFGRPEAAAAAKLYIAAAGPAEDLETARPVFAAIGQRVFELGATPSAAILVKLCGNFMILATIEALGEAMSLGERGGVPKARLLEVLTGTLFDAPVYRTYGAIIAQERFKPAGFAVPLGLKDMRLVGQSAETLRVPMPLLSLLRDHLLQTIAVEGNDIDWSGIALTVAKNAGIGKPTG